LDFLTDSCPSPFPPLPLTTSLILIFLSMGRSLRFSSFFPCPAPELRFAYYAAPCRLVHLPPSPLREDFNPPPQKEVPPAALDPCSFSWPASLFFLFQSPELHVFEFLCLSRAFFFCFPPALRFSPLPFFRSYVPFLGIVGQSTAPPLRIHFFTLFPRFSPPFVFPDLDGAGGGGLQTRLRFFFWSVHCPRTVPSTSFLTGEPSSSHQSCPFRWNFPGSLFFELRLLSLNRSRANHLLFLDFGYISF